MRVKQVIESVSDIYKYDKQIQGIFRNIARELIRKHDMEMITSPRPKVHVENTFRLYVLA